MVRLQNYMAEIQDVYLTKARESLEGAESESANGRYNNCANRSYYACFQAAIAALLRENITPRGIRWLWHHDYVQSEFVGQLINRRKRYPADIRDVLERNYSLRQTADYEDNQITQAQASRGLRWTRRFLEIVLEGGEIA